jgi:hypothetical protein
MFSPGSDVFQQGQELSVEVNQRALIDSELGLVAVSGDLFGLISGYISRLQRS